MTKDEEDAVLEQARQITERRNAAYAEEAKRVEARVLSLATRGVTPEHPAFADADLTYAATARCRCGAGYAYPNGSGAHGRWDCAAILKGEAAHGSEHDGALPFAFYSVKGERQPSAHGATTRPT